MPELMEYPGQKAGESVNGLLKEYAVKLLDLHHKIIDTKKEHCDEIEKRAWRDYQFDLEVPLMDLVRHASQLIEHGGIDETTRVEMRLRLAELEFAQRAVRSAALNL